MGKLGKQIGKIEIEIRKMGKLGNGKKENGKQWEKEMEIERVLKRVGGNKDMVLKSLKIRDKIERFWEKLDGK